MSFRAVVVDDEPLAREGLAADLAERAIDVVALCGDGYSAREAIVQHKPDVVFLDIQMPEVDGFALLEMLEPEETPPVVVFVTAHEQHAVRAFEARAVDYLLKPVGAERLDETVRRAQQRLAETHAARENSAPAVAHPATGYLTQLLVHDRDEVTVIPVEQLEWIEAETYYVRLHAKGSKPRLLRERMSVLESRLDPARFFRTHRSAIVKLDLVRSVRTLSRYESVVVLSTGAEVPVSRERKARLEARLAT